jgi:serine/threonine protein kinase
MEGEDIDQSSIISKRRLDEAFGGKYSIGEIIGQGAFGTVRKLIDRQNKNKVYAVKVLN